MFVKSVTYLYNYVINAISLRLRFVVWMSVTCHIIAQVKCVVDWMWMTTNVESSYRKMWRSFIGFCFRNLIFLIVCQTWYQIWLTLIESPFRSGQSGSNLVATCDKIALNKPTEHLHHKFRLCEWLCHWPQQFNPSIHRKDFPFKEEEKKRWISFLVDKQVALSYSIFYKQMSTIYLFITKMID